MAEEAEPLHSFAQNCAWCKKSSQDRACEREVRVLPISKNAYT